MHKTYLVRRAQHKYLLAAHKVVKDSCSENLTDSLISDRQQSAESQSSEERHRSTSDQGDEQRHEHEQSQQSERDEYQDQEDYTGPRDEEENEEDVHRETRHEDSTKYEDLFN